MSPRVVISEFMDAAAVARLSRATETRYDPDLVDAPAALLEALPGAEALIVRNRTQVTKTLLDAAPELRCVGRLGVGLDNIDLEACSARGVKVIPATGANTLSVAEYVITTAMMLIRGSYLATDAVICGDWPRGDLIGREISGRTMGLIGYGGIARAVASRARALGMSIIAHDPFLPPEDPAWSETKRASVREVLQQSDVVSLHVPLTDDTRGLIDAAAISAMGQGAVLINTARGGVVDEAALAEALAGGQLAGAALDVFADEPLSHKAAAKFKGLRNLVLTPHIGGVTEDSNIRVSQMIADAVLDHLSG